MRKMVATLMVGGWVEGTLCCAPGDDGWWLEAKKLAADIKRRAVARVLTDEDSGEAGEVLGDVEVAEGLEAGADCEWGEAWESMRSQVWESDGEGVDWGEPGAGVEGEVWPPKVDSGELTTEEYDGRVTPEEVTGPLTVHEEGVGRLGRARGAGGGARTGFRPASRGCEEPAAPQDKQAHGESGGRELEWGHDRPGGGGGGMLVQHLRPGVGDDGGGYWRGDSTGGPLPRAGVGWCQGKVEKGGGEAWVGGGLLRKKRGLFSLAEKNGNGGKGQGK